MMLESSLFSYRFVTNFPVQHTENISLASYVKVSSEPRTDINTQGILTYKWNLLISGEMCPLSIKGQHQAHQDSHKDALHDGD